MLTKAGNKNKSGLFSCPYRILDYFSDILFTLSTTFILITKLKSLSVLNLSVRPSVCLSVCLYFCLSTIFLTSSWHSEQLLFWWVSWKIFLSSFCLSVCLSVCWPVFLSFWYPVVSVYLSDILLTFLATFVLITKLKSLSVWLSVCLSVCRPVLLSFWHPVDILNKFCFDN